MGFCSVFRRTGTLMRREKPNASDVGFLPDEDARSIGQDSHTQASYNMLMDAIHAYFYLVVRNADSNTALLLPIIRCSLTLLKLMRGSMGRDVSLATRRERLDRCQRRRRAITASIISRRRSCRRNRS